MIEWMVEWINEWIKDGDNNAWIYPLYTLTAENVETTVEAETVTAVSQQTSEADDDEDEVTPVTDSSQTQTGVLVQSIVQQRQRQ